MKEPWDDPDLVLELPVPPDWLATCKADAERVVAVVCPACGAALHEGACHLCGIAYRVERMEPLKMTSWLIS